MLWIKKKRPIIHVSFYNSLKKFLFKSRFCVRFWSFFKFFKISRVKKGPLTNLDSSCPRSLLKITPLPPGYPWVSGGRYVTPEPRFSGLVLDHQGLEELEPKIHPKTAVFDQIWLFLNGFLVMVLLKVDGWAPNPKIWVLGSHTNP